MYHALALDFAIDDDDHVCKDLLDAILRNLRNERKGERSEGRWVGGREGREVERKKGQEGGKQEAGARLGVRCRRRNVT